MSLPPLSSSSPRRPPAEAVAERQFLACRAALEGLRRRLDGSPLSPRRRGQLLEQGFFLLQFLTVTTDRTIEDATPEDVETWLAPARGYSTYDLRLSVLELLSPLAGNPALRRPPQAGHALARRLREVVFWRDHQRRVHDRTSPHFRSITQEEILETEIRCEPFYRALHAVYPAASGAGVFADSDEIVVSLLRRRRGGAARPSIADLGCGSGRLLRRLGSAFPGARLHGTSIFQFADDERRALERAGITPVFSTGSDTGLPDGSQDIVVSTEVIEHLRHPEEMVREIHRLLKPGGVFCVTAPSRSAVMYNRNPLSYLAVAVGTRFPSVLPPFHDLYAPLTPLRIVHHAFHPRDYRAMFAARFDDVEVLTSRFTALRKLRLDALAPSLPVLRWMGGLCIAAGSKPRVDRAHPVP